MKTSRISFNGIYDVNYAKSTDKKVIFDDMQKLDNLLQKRHADDWVKIHDFDSFSTKNPNGQKGYRIVSTIDNPYLIADLLSVIDSKLVNQYIEQTKINLVV